MSKYEPAERPSCSQQQPGASQLGGAGLGAAGDAEDPMEQLRQENVKALLSNKLETCRAPVTRLLSTQQQAEVTLRKPFISPKPGAPAMSDAVRRHMQQRWQFVPWGSKTPLPSITAKPMLLLTEAPFTAPPAPAPVEVVLPAGVEPLVLWLPPGTPEDVQGDAGAAACVAGAVVVDPMLTRWLRPHQREGVAFMFQCVTGLRLGEQGQGCILADDMGLGKTLQAITLLWTCISAGHADLGGQPIAKRTIIVCPVSLVSNWESECEKWLLGRLRVLALCEAGRDEAASTIGSFLHPASQHKVLILSYEAFRIHAERFTVPGACDLLICDEAHRLKNDATLTSRALGGLACRRRVLLSGTPMQNHLDEFYAMVDFCNPGVLGSTASFRKRYEVPILAGREPGATADQVALGEERSGELSSLVNAFIMRRTNKLLSAHLPPKVVQVVCCRLTPLQHALYCGFLESKAARRLLSGKATGVLPAICALRKLCNHPRLIYDMLHAPNAVLEKGEAKPCGFEKLGTLFPPGVFDDGRVGRGQMCAGWEALGGKFALTARMLDTLYAQTDDRVVIVSNFTQTLDLLSTLCRQRSWPFVRLDGSTSITKRQKLVKIFNDKTQKQYIFLLSSKAGGCGLNLIGANRLILFDPDWNPANDKQAMGRVWRDGQTKRVYVYRLLTAGTLEEKVFQRQLSKEGLQQLVGHAGKAAASMMSTEELRELFSLAGEESGSDTYDKMCANKLTPAAGDSGKDGGGDKAGAAEDADMDAEADDGASSDEGMEEEDGADGPDVVDLAGSSDEEEDAKGHDSKRSSLPAGDRAEGGPSKGSGSGAAGGDTEGKPKAPLNVLKAQDGNPAEDDLKAWGHHSDTATVPDLLLTKVAGEDVTFVFSCQVAGKPIDTAEPDFSGSGANPRERSLAGAGGYAAPALKRARISSAGGCGSAGSGAGLGAGKVLAGGSGAGAGGGGVPGLPRPLAAGGIGRLATAPAVPTAQGVTARGLALPGRAGSAPAAGAAFAARKPMMGVAPGAGALRQPFKPVKQPER